MNTFFVRLTTGLIGAAIVISAILFSRYTYGAVVLAIVIGGVWEFLSITATAQNRSEADNRKNRRVIIGLTVLSFLLSWLFNFRYVFADVAVLLPAILFFFFVRELFTKSETPFQNIGWNIMPFIYIVLPVMLLNWLYFEKGELFALAILFMIWFYDSMCYIAGSTIGRTKLLERISPKKTVEGLLGGMVLTLILVFFYDKILGFLVNTYHFNCAQYSNIEWLIIGLITLIFATLGDLVESMLKRSLNIKDSGSIMPGHGGFLDRLDAILVAIPFTVLIVWLVDQAGSILFLVNFLK
jgi:phosphatidate cytidylyltransferase